MPGVDVGQLRAMIRASGEAALVLAFGTVLVVGVLHLLSGVGLLMHKSWARAIGIVLALLGTLFSAAGVLYAATPNTIPPAAIVPAAYAFTLLALILGGGHFVRRLAR